MIISTKNQNETKDNTIKTNKNHYYLFQKTTYINIKQVQFKKERKCTSYKKKKTIIHTHNNYKVFCCKNKTKIIY